MNIGSGHQGLEVINQQPLAGEFQIQQRIFHAERGDLIVPLTCIAEASIFAVASWICPLLAFM